MRPTVTPDLEGRDPIAILLDERAIQRVLLRYCRAADRADLDLMRSCYWPDARDAHGAFSGPLDEYITWVGPMIERFERTTHHITNTFIELQADPEVARVETYVLAYHRYDDAGRTMDMLLGLRYVDRFERRGNEWRIADRVCSYDWRHEAPNPGNEGFTPRHPRSSRGPDDWLHHILDERPPTFTD